MMFGEGLAWEESVPGQVETRLGAPSAVLAVHGLQRSGVPAARVRAPAVSASEQARQRLLVPYHGDAVIDRGVEVTRDVLRATARLARARGAAPLILVPQFGPEDVG